MTRKKYIVVKVEWPACVEKLTALVNHSIDAGYVPLGGITVWNDKLKGRCMAQSMALVDR